MHPGFHPSPSLLKPDWRAIGPALLLAVALFAFATPARALIIIPVWDSSITNDPNAATIQGTINMAIQFYEARFADPITVSITFQKESIGLGTSFSFFAAIPYTQFLANLQRDATTTNDAIALAHLPPGPNNPVTGDANIKVKTANLKALGITGYEPPNGIDGAISLNTSIMNLTRANINPDYYDLLGVAEHEIDEVLGLGSDLAATNDPFPQDLFRYSSTGARTFTTDGDDAWFSLDGTNLLVRFNQQPDGDYGDWWSNDGQPHTPRVQDAFFTPGATPHPTVELIALDVQGYDLIPPPQPGIVNITLSGANLVLNGANGLATATYCLLTTTNLALPVNQWSSVATNVLTANGNFSFTATNAVIPNSPRQFYILQLLQ
ncbi:MAG: NF038122 family metalloprotease [Verrucomicrobiota bacterium]|jgi:hypothetical protein